jgi:hypothetical protein
MRFLNSLSDQLAAMEQRMQALPEELDSIMVRLNRDKWENLLVRVNEDSNKLLDRLSTPRINGVFSLPLIFDIQSLSFTPITSKDKARWRDAHKPDIRVLIGKGKVQVMAVSEASSKGEADVYQTRPFSQQQGYTMLNWDKYQNLLDEIGKLISGND